MSTETALSTEVIDQQSGEITIMPIGGGMRLLGIAQMTQAAQYVQDMKRSILVDGTDYMVIPGTGKDAKPSLLKPGAEKLAAAFRLYATYETVRAQEDEWKEWDYEVAEKKWNGKFMEPTGKKTIHYVRGWYRYHVRCTLKEIGTDQVRGSAEGICESTERGRENAPSNAILKFAQKRAHTQAVLNATYSSGLFTQDIDDDPDMKSAAKEKAKPKAEVPSATRPSDVQGPAVAPSDTASAVQELYREFCTKGGKEASLNPAVIEVFNAAENGKLNTISKVKADFAVKNLQEAIAGL